MKYDQLLDEVSQVVLPVLESRGFELVELEYQREAQGWVLRFYLDRAGGVTVEDCAEVSRELGPLLDVQDLIPYPYILEVSSPGLTRPLKKPEDFKRFGNHLVKIKTFQPVEGRRNFKGTLLGLEEEKVRIEVDGQTFEIPMTAIAKANLEIEF